MTKMWVYLKVAVIALIGLLSYFFIRSKAGKQAVLEEKRRNLEARKRVYEQADVDTSKQEERLVNRIDELDMQIRIEPTPNSPSSAANRLRKLMGWDSQGSGKG